MVRLWAKAMFSTRKLLTGIPRCDSARREKDILEEVGLQPLFDKRPTANVDEAD